MSEITRVISNSLRPFEFVQRMRMKNKDNQVQFEHRFESDFMSHPHFHQGRTCARIVELHQSCEVGEVMVDGVLMLTAFNPEKATKHEVEQALNAIYHGDIKTRERTNFNRDYRRLPLEQRWTNSWMEIDTGVFWTWERCNISDIRKNFARTAAVLQNDERFAIRSNPPPAPQVPNDPLRQRLIDAGVLRPRS